MVVVWSQYGSICSSEPVASARMRPGILAWASTEEERSPTRAMRGGAGMVMSKHHRPALVSRSNDFT